MPMLRRIPILIRSKMRRKHCKEKIFGCWRLAVGNARQKFQMMPYETTMLLREC